MIRRATLFALLLGTSAALVVEARQDVELFDDLSGGNAFFAGTWEASSSFTGSVTPAASFVQGSGVFDIKGDGVTNDGNSFLELHFATALNLSADNAIELNGSVLTGNEATSLEVRLFDQAGKSARATVLTADLPSTVHWVARPGFDAATVEIVRISGGQLDGTARVAVQLDSLATVFEAIPVVYHDADWNQDYRLSLDELLRVIELYNTRSSSTRTGRYQVQVGTEDGFATDSATPAGASANLSRYHTADMDQNAQLSLGELLRVIELYNTRFGSTRSGEYHADPTSTDGFASGPPPGG